MLPPLYFRVLKRTRGNLKKHTVGISNKKRSTFVKHAYQQVVGCFDIDDRVNRQKEGRTDGRF